jgi:pSer/pThr/pTyr-binding forkhead associated (FHA) protein
VLKIKAKLLLKYEGLTLNTLVLESDALTIGRANDNDVILDDAAVSSHHAQFIRIENEYLEGHYYYEIEDLGSTNGTKVNDETVKQHRLQHGDRIQIGIHEFLFDSGEPQKHETTAIYLPDE